ncbi:efflux transporter outer membrane subunit [Parasphingopyxis marina]|uniref:TolC family protein n=1 Tax=Parasphingopyxis marina TaxID=2761622 RepID=A0A842I103_9SPHN|nr:TolC family protein [Parasphingopyxis marina]MBC2778892.1 TolC family protein [Parasphingopyxis marina]
MRPLLSLTSLLVLAACAVGPDYVEPLPPSSAQGDFVSLGDAVTTDAPRGDWWRLYDDPVLDGFVTQALEENTDIRVALANVARARAGLRRAGSDAGPELEAGLGGNYGRSIAPDGGLTSEDWQFQASAGVSYEIDLFGRVSRGVEAARGDLAAAEADAQAVRILVAAETTRAYADFVAAREQLAVAERIVALLDESLSLTQRRREVGLATRFDTARLATLRDQRSAEVPLFAARRDAALFSLAALTGNTPAGFPASAIPRHESLALDTTVPVGDGAALLARRPDVRAAERRLAAATARVGVVTADLFPRISLGASAASVGGDLGDVLTGGPIGWLLGGLLDWAINPGRAEAEIAIANAEADGLLAEFDGAVLRALQETDTALSAYGHSLERQAALGSALEEARAALRIAQVRQREGDIGLLELLDAQRTFADTEADYSGARADVASAQIDLFLALGGGWGDRPA